MTDLANTMGPTLTCQGCAAQVPVEDAVVNGFRCTSCNAEMTARPDYTGAAGSAGGGGDTVELQRAYRAYGYSLDFTADDAGNLVCPECGNTAEPGSFEIDTVQGGDSGGSTTDGIIAALRCGKCRAPGTVALGGSVQLPTAGEEEATRLLLAATR